MARCAARKPDGSPCERIVGAQQRYCYAHDPTTAEQRRRNATKGGRGKPNKELAAVKERLRKLAEQVLDGEVDRDDAGVAARIYGVYLRADEQERKVREQEEVLVRLERLERLEQKREGGRRRRG